MMKTSMAEAIKKYALLYGAFFIYSFVSVCSKLASGQSTLLKMGIFLALEVMFLGIYAIIWQQVLKHFSLVQAMSSKGVVVILNLLWSVLLFSEKITLFNVIGAGMIILGIWVVSTDV